MSRRYLIGVLVLVRDSNGFREGGSVAKLCLYTRVSTLPQEDGTSLEVQKAMITSYCALYGHEIAGEYSDTESGANDEREGFQKALKAIYDGGADGIVVYNLSRLTRAMSCAATIARDFQRLGKQIVSVSETIDTTKPSGVFIYHVLAAAAHWQRDQLKEATQQAKKHRRAQGYWTGWNVPYGWKVAILPEHQHMKRPPKSLVPDVVEQGVIALVKEMRERYTHTGRRWGYLRIANELNRLAVPTKRVGNVWSQVMVYRLLSDPSVVLVGKRCPVWI